MCRPADHGVFLAYSNVHSVTATPAEIRLLVLSQDMFPVSHKTVIVLDRCPYFAESSQQPVEFDMLVKSKIAGVVPLAPITKSLWTCNVEAVLEYIRVLYDLFPGSKLVCSDLA